MGKRIAGEHNVVEINLGGEGEVPGVLNQQPPGALTADWRSQGNRTLAELAAAGIPFLICPNEALAISDGSVDRVLTNAVPVGGVSTLGPGVQRTEVERILKSGGEWIWDSRLHYTKP